MPEEQTTTRRRTRKINVNLFGRKKTGGTDGIEQSMKGFQSQRIEDPFDSAYSTTGATGTLNVLQPSYPPHRLHKLPNESSILRQCIDAYVVNIEGHGYRFEYIGPDDAEDSAESRMELQHLESLAETPNEEYSLTELRSRCRRDYETYGYYMMEVTRDLSGNVRMMYHVPAHTVRMTSQDKEAVEVEAVIWRNGKYIKQKVMKRFRKFVQMVGARKVYLKEFGDPRVINAKTGMPDEEVGVEDEATEIIHVCQYAPDESYGLPRWISQLPSILGMRESEMNNLQFFKDNAIPAMAVLISGGMLTDEASENIEHQFTGSRGRDSMNRVLVIEAVGDENTSAEDGKVPAPKLDIKPLVDERQKDGMFQEYENKCIQKIRSSFRLPPLFVGTTEDMTHATAAASLSVAEAQVFGPERVASDEVFNKKLFMLNGEPPKYWRLRSQPPRLVNPEDVINALQQFERVGAMTPNVAIGLANEMFDLDVPVVTESWGNFPFMMVMRMLAKGEINFETGQLTGQSQLEKTPEETPPTETKSAEPKPEPEVEQPVLVRQAMDEGTVTTVKKGGAKVARIRTRPKRKDD